MTQLQQAHLAISEILAEQIAPMFKPGVRLTLVARNPTLPGDTGLMVTDDTEDGVIAEIRKLVERGRAMAHPLAAPSPASPHSSPRP